MIEKLHEKLIKGELKSSDLVKESIAKSKEFQDKYNMYVTLLDNVEDVEITDSLLSGIPYACKDNFSTAGILSTGSSNILKDYVPFFDATVIKKLKENNAVMIGKTVLDELAMGGTGTTGHTGIVRNPWDETRLIGGSSAGSAAAVALGVVPYALGSDTGDSVRKPASYAGLVGMKPTWGRISRYGLFPFAPSLDHVGYFTRDVYSSAALLSVLAGRDLHDSTSSTKPVENYLEDLDKPVKGMRIAVIQEIYDSLTNEELKKHFDRSLEKLKEQGIAVDFVKFGVKLLESLYATYMVISCAEATSNDANLDGIKFGEFKGGKTYQEVMFNARNKGFSELIKRRFVIGSYCLMSENQEELFLRAQRNRAKIVETVNSILKDHDFIYVPAAPNVAPTFDAASDRLSDEYLIVDNHLCLGNFAGLPSITLPLFFQDGLPIGINFMGRAFEEKKLFQIANAFEKLSGLKDVSVLNKKEGNL